MVMAVVVEADRLYNENKFEELYQYLLQYTTSEDHELLWRIIRAYYKRCFMKDMLDEDNEKERRKLISDGMEVAKRALNFGEDDYACHKWYGMMLNRSGDFLTTKVKIDNALKIRSHYEKAVELCPTDTESHHLIGVWCFRCADISDFERKVSRIAMDTPPSSTYEEALTHFKKAEEISPSSDSDNQYMIGLTNMKMGNEAEAKVWFHKFENYNGKRDEEKVKKTKEHFETFASDKLYMAGLTNLEKGEKSEAKVWFEKFLDFNGKRDEEKMKKAKKHIEAL